jgi:hypothetical protein
LHSVSETFLGHHPEDLNYGPELNIRKWGTRSTVVGVGISLALAVVMPVIACGIIILHGNAVWVLKRRCRDTKDANIAI